MRQWNQPMRQFCIQATDQRLIIKPERAKDILVGISIFAAITVLSIACLSGHPKLCNSVTKAQIWLDDFPAWLVCATILGRFFLVLRRQVFIFDRPSGQVVVNDKPVHPMAELQSVCLERSFYRQTRSLHLYLRTKNKVKMEIVSDGLFGVDEAEMLRIANTIASFARINLITPDGFIPADRGMAGATGEPAKRFRKGYRQPPSRQPKARLGSIRGARQLCLLSITDAHACNVSQADC